VGKAAVTFWKYLAADTYFKDTESNANKFLDAIRQYNQEVFPPR